jgi:hypothetical protein
VASLLLGSVVAPSQLGSVSSAGTASAHQASWPAFFASTLDAAALQGGGGHLKEEFAELGRRALADEQCHSSMFQDEVAKVGRLLHIHTPQHIPLEASVAGSMHHDHGIYCQGRQSGGTACC